MKPNKYDIEFLREVASFGPFALSEVLPQRSYPSVKARNRCRAMGLVRYVPRAPRKGCWYLSAAGRATLSPTAINSLGGRREL